MSVHPRHFARVGAALVVALGACTHSAPSPTSHAGGEGARVRLEFDDVGGEVWSFARRVSGRADGACRSIDVERGEERHRVSPHEGRFAARVGLHGGDNRVRILCVGSDGVVRASAENVYRVRLAERPTARVRIALNGDGALMLDAGASTRAEASPEPIVSWRWTASSGNPEPLIEAEGSAFPVSGREHLVLATPAGDGTYEVELELRDAAGRNDRARGLFRVEDGAPVLVDPEVEPPAWIDRAVVYGVVPFLFGTAPFDAVREHLALFEALGVDTLWISPMQEFPEGDFGYEVLDHFTVHEAYGGPDALRALVDEAHRRHLRVLADFVPNHTSRGHAYFRDVEANGTRSPYWSFYERDAAGEPIHYFDWDHLPNLDFDHPEVRRMILEAAAQWVQRFDIDGLRVDVAWGVDERAPELFAEIRRELVRTKPDAFMLAEASARRPHYFHAGFDAAYDWSERVGQWAWQGVFDEGRADLRVLDGAITASERALPAGAHVFRFLDNNDTGERFATKNGDDSFRVASILLFTLPGIPTLFTGEESSADYLPYEREEPLALDPKPELVAHLSALAALRRAEPAFTEGGFVAVPAEPRDRVYAFVRDGVARPALVVLNFGGTAVEAHLDLPDSMRAGLRSAPLVDRWGEAGPATVRNGRLTLRVGDHAARILLPGAIERATSVHR